MSESLHVDGHDDPSYTASFAVCVGCMSREKAQTTRDEIDTKIEKTGGKVWRASRRWVLTRVRGTA